MDIDPQRIAGDLLFDMEAGWNASDGDMFARLFAQDAVFVTTRGETIQSRAAIARAHQALLDSTLSGSDLHFQLLQARLLAPTVIVAQATHTLKVPLGPQAGEQKALSTVVIAHIGNGWCMAALQNTIVSPA